MSTQTNTVERRAHALGFANEFSAVQGRDTELCKQAYGAVMRASENRVRTLSDATKALIQPASQ